MLTKYLSALHATCSGRICRYQDSDLAESTLLALPNEESVGSKINFVGNSWILSYTTQPVPGSDDAIDLIARFKLVQGNAVDSSVGLCLDIDQWSKDNYVLMPAAVYNGNRFESRHMVYPPLLIAPSDIGPDVPAIITDVPRLNIHDGPSKIQLLTGDLSTPAIGFFSPHQSKGFWLLTDQGTVLGNSGFDIEENADRTHAVIRVYAPGVREHVRYTIGNTQCPSEDRSASIEQGAEVTLRLRMYTFECRDIQGLFNRFVEIRKDLAGPTHIAHELPLSEAWTLIEDKYNRQNWVEKQGYYTVGIGEEMYAKWQIGWNGGLMTTHPLISEGGPTTRSRAIRNFEFVFPNGQAPSGLFRGIGDGERWYNDGFGKPHAENWHFIRKSSDALYFITKQFDLLKKQDPEWIVPAAWEEGTRRCADVLVRLWDRYGQFGQFVDIDTGDIVVGGSTAASTAPAGLALAGQLFDEDNYLRVAGAAGSHFYERYVKTGCTIGGAGEICQCPDSESAFGLLESFITLYEVTGDRNWVDRAQDVANQCATWCVSYDFEFPPQSTFAQMGMRTTGAVYANAQNKHGAPGICTLSGASLLKLYRATGNTFYLQLIRDIAHNITQYLSRPDRPISGMPSGWMNERVNMSDWLEPVGEVFCGSNWPESSCIMTYVEVPGLYVQPDTGLAYAIDHVDVSVTEKDSERLVLRLTNPTRFEARVKVLAENSEQMSAPLGQNFLYGCREIVLKPETSELLEFKRSANTTHE